MEIKKLLFNLALSLMFFAYKSAYSQESVHSSGGEASGIGGVVSYSVGQLVYTLISDNGGSLAHGVQQAYEILAVGIPESESTLSLSLYPNPAVDVLILTIENMDKDKLNFQLIDNQGRILKNGIIENELIQIPISSLAGNVYFLNVNNSQNNQVKSFKIIKK